MEFFLKVPPLPNPDPDPNPNPTPDHDPNPNPMSISDTCEVVAFGFIWTDNVQFMLADQDLLKVRVKIRARAGA